MRPEAGGYTPGIVSQVVEQVWPLPFSTKLHEGVVSLASGINDLESGRRVIDVGRAVRGSA